VGEERLNTLTMINVENEMISRDVDFNKKIIDIFSGKEKKKIDA